MVTVGMGDEGFVHRTPRVNEKIANSAVQTLGIQLKEGHSKNYNFLLALFFCFLHPSLQYFTSSQTACHFLRHTKGRPQARQILLGKNALLPL
jgi:hypothetical protein